MILNHEVSRGIAAVPARATTFEFADSLLGVLDHVERVGQPARLTLRGGRGQGMTVDPRRRLCDVAGADVDLLCAIRPEDIALSYGEEARQPMLRPRPLAELRWRIGYLGSGGLPVQGSSRFDVVRFTDWPNLSRLPHDEDCVRLLALLTRHPTSIALARSITGIEMEKINRIYAAGLAAGLVEVINRRQPLAAVPGEPANDEPVGQAPVAGGAAARALVGTAPGAGHSYSDRSARTVAGGAAQAADRRRADVHLASEADEAAAAAPAAPARGWVSSLFKRLRAL
ncbi:hypothetical protein [Derxia gummosa]|uniref:Uncharacterized protein n=1 Tax=Derxia gummosa DSM 723 TaxID=1121388 RepID=A0A8B6X6P6_9BURK|nr:hypothetical protein [Derxia gummosa]